MSVSELREMGRATQGVRLISLKKDDKIAAITKVQEKALNGSNDQEYPQDNDNDGEEEKTDVDKP